MPLLVCFKRVGHIKMAYITELEFFESLYLDNKTSQRQSFREKCYALRNFLDDCEFERAQADTQDDKQDFWIDNGIKMYIENIKSEIYEVLMGYGFNARLVGTRYIVYAALVKSYECELGMMELYERCAKYYGVSSKSVENACRYACAKAENVDKTLCTYYENVTPYDVVKKLAQDVSQRFDTELTLDTIMD